ISTNPAAGALVAPGTEVTLVVSKGKAPITVPSVIGKSLQEAQQILQGLGLAVAVTQQDSDKPKDQVLAQDPVDGSGREKGQTTALTVSSGPPATPVPNVVGQPCGAAVAQLQAAGFTTRVFGFEAAAVSNQNPDAGTPEPAGTQITLVCFG